MIGESRDLADLVQLPVLLPGSGIRDGPIVMWPVVGLPAIVPGDGPGSNLWPLLRGIVDQHGVMGHRAQMIVHIVARAESVVVSPVADKFLVPIHQEVAHIKMLMSREAVPTLEKEVGGIVVP